MPEGGIGGHPEKPTRNTSDLTDRHQLEFKLHLQRAMVRDVIFRALLAEETVRNVSGGRRYGVKCNPCVEHAPCSTALVGMAENN
jgi:hypothetical protein